MGTVVQDQSSSFDTGVSSSWAIAFGSNVTAGNLIYVWAGAGDDATGADPTDTLTNAYTLIRDTYDATNNQSHSSWYAENIAGGANTVTLAASYQTANTKMGVLEISGLQTASPVDVEVGAVDTTTNGTDVAGDASGSLLTSASHALLVCSIQNINEAETGTLTYSAGTNYTARSPAGLHSGKMQTRAVTSTGTYSAAFTGNANQRSIGHGVAFKDQGTAAITGTATATIDETDVVAGGNTIIITLTSDTFVVASAANIQHVGSRVGSFAGTTSAQTVTLGSLTGGDTGDTTPQAGDLVLVTYAIGSTVARTPTIATPGGGAAYTDANAVLTQSDNFDASMLVAYKFMGGTPDTQVTLSETGGGTGNIADAGAYTIQVFRGVDSSTPLDVAVVTGGAANSSAVNPGQITPSTAGAVVVAMGAAASGTGSTMTSSDLTDFVATSRADTNDISIGSGHIVWDNVNPVDPAAYGNIPAGTTANSWVSLTIALRPLVTTPFADARQAIIDGLDSAQAEGTGWNAEVRDNLAVGTVVRTSDTVCTITLSAQAAYNITAQETITVTVPATALTGGVQIVATPTFTVDTDGGGGDPSILIFVAVDMANIADMKGMRG